MSALLRLLGVLWAYLVSVFRRAAPPPAPIPTADFRTNLANSILAFNNGLAAFSLGRTYYDPKKGVTLHELDLPAAMDVAGAILSFVQPGDDNPPLALTLGLIGSESGFDPAAENDNLLGSNTTGDPAGDDVGLCQLKLRYITAPDVTAARAIALDPTRALPIMVGDLREHLTWAASVQSQLTGSAVTPQAHNVYWLAVAAYKYGKTGALNYALDDSFPRNAAGKCEADQVADLEARFAKELTLKAYMGE